MTELLDRLLPGWVSKLNLAADLLLLFMVLRATSVWLGPSDSTSLWVFVASGAVWVVVATALQYYHRPLMPARRWATPPRCRCWR